MQRCKDIYDFFFLLKIKNAPEQFTSEEFPISESKVSMDVSFPGAAFVVVSCKENQLGFRKKYVHFFFFIVLRF